MHKTNKLSQLSKLTRLWKKKLDKTWSNSEKLKKLETKLATKSVLVEQNWQPRGNSLKIEIDMYSTEYVFNYSVVCRAEFFC